jgi:hypothetical protein
MSAFRFPSLADPTDAPAATPAARVTVHVEDDKGRDALLAWAARHLPAGECLVELKDLASRRRSFETRPLDPRAELVAESVPKLVRGSLLVRTRWYRVPTDALAAEEAHAEDGVVTHSYDIKLTPVVTGVAARGRATVPA